MTDADRDGLDPDAVLAEVAAVLPVSVRDTIVIIGSLAAGHHFFGAGSGQFMRTKDVDCLITPRVAAVDAGTRLTETLLANGWTFRQGGAHGVPGDADTPLDRLPAVRLRPPGTAEWFLELLTAPNPSLGRERHWLRIETSHGHFGLPSFGFLSIAVFKPVTTRWGIHVARPSMMALANLLENPVIKHDTMSGLVAGREMKRSNKDLGRVLALARLAGDDAVERWPLEWHEAIESVFPAEWRSLAKHAGDGLRQLLANPDDLEEAVVTCNTGLLSSMSVRADQLRATGERFLADAVQPFEQFARDAKP